MHDARYRILAFYKHESIPELLQKRLNFKIMYTYVVPANFKLYITQRKKKIINKISFSERRAPKVPVSNLRPGGGFYEKTETSEFFSDPRDKEAELMAELAKDAEEEEEKKKREEEERSRLRKEEEMKLLVSKLEDLKGPPLEIPEYKDAYKVDYTRNIR